uniref:NADP-dependent oxidoreductase domain-containing protein n=1 Tax=Pyrodinium bahamense TaxID=73915 RepID=A0A7R9ZUP5_9DINO
MAPAAWVAWLCAGVAVAPARAAVCGRGKVPCFSLAGGTSIPQVAMGTWGGSYKDCAPTDYACIEQHARFAVDNWLRIGGTHVDGANNYRTQSVVGDALAVSGLRREDVFITTKCPGAMGFEATIQCADDNLQMLGQFGAGGVQHIDLLLVHFPFTVKPACRFHKSAPECQPPNSPIVPAGKAALLETWRAMEELKRLGVVKAIGVSDYNVTQLSQTLEIAKEPIELNQVEWNPKEHDEKMFAFCQKHGILLQAWSPLGGSQGSVLPDPTIARIAAARNRTAAQVTLRWSLQRGLAVVVGTANPDHARDDLDVFGFELTEDEVQSISALQVRESSAIHI